MGEKYAPEKVKEINDQVVSELIKEMRNCSSCGCTGISAADKLKQHQVISTKKHKWDLLSPAEKKIIKHFKDRPYEAQTFATDQVWVAE